MAAGDAQELFHFWRVGKAEYKAQEILLYSSQEQNLCKCADLLLRARCHCFRLMLNFLWYGCPEASYTAFSLLSFDCCGGSLPSGTYSDVQLRSLLNAQYQEDVSPEHPTASVKLICYWVAGCSKLSWDWQ